MPAYRSDDRSILLPYYKRWLIDPFLRFIPARVHPNVITHVGHILCLLAAVLVAGRPIGGWRLVAMAVLLQVYIWCDNADGAHARRTKQSSDYGEFLDHGLDLLNTVYISIMTACIFDASPGWTALMVTMIPAAAAVTVWEQAETGVFRLGLLNQIESCAIISGCALLAAVVGVPFYRDHSLAGIRFDLFLMGWPAVTILFGYARALVRVRGADGNIAPALVFLSAQACVVAAVVFGFASALAACAFATAANLYFGVHMFVLRLHGERPPTPPLLTAGLVGAALFLASRGAGVDVPSGFSSTLVAVFGVVAGAASVLEARRGVHLLARAPAPARV